MFIHCFGPKQVANKHLKLGFYAYIIMGVISVIVWEQTDVERFDQQVALSISITGLIIIGQHVLSEVIIFYTQYILRVKLDNGGESTYDDYCEWLKEEGACIGPYPIV